MTQYSGSPLHPRPFEDGLFIAGSEELEEEQEDDMDTPNTKNDTKFCSTLFKNPFDDLQEGGIKLHHRHNDY